MINKLIIIESLLNSSRRVLYEVELKRTCYKILTVENRYIECAKSTKPKTITTMIHGISSVLRSWKTIIYTGMSDTREMRVFLVKFLSRGSDPYETECFSNSNYFNCIFT